MVRLVHHEEEYIETPIIYTRKQPSYLVSSTVNSLFFNVKENSGSLN